MTVIITERKGAKWSKIYKMFFLNAERLTIATKTWKGKHRWGENGFYESVCQYAEERGPAKVAFGKA